MKDHSSRRGSPGVQASRPAALRMEQSPQSDRAGHSWGLALLLVIITVASYVPAMRCGFVWDDDFYIQNNQTLTSVDGLRQIWFELRATPQYYPVVFTSYWLEYRLWGLSPAGYHVVNILLHSLGAVLLWRILALLEVRGAWLAAALFALHPVHVESVAWVTERKNVLSGVFYFGAALLYLGAALWPNRRMSARRYAVFLLLFLCALLSKTVTCTLPAALLLVLWWKRGRWCWKDVLPLAPLFTLGIGAGLLTAWMERSHVGAVGEEWNLSFLDRCLVAGRVVCFYAAKLVWPHPWTFIYPRWQIDAHAWWQYLFPLIVLEVIAGLWLLRQRIDRGPLVSVLFFVGTLFPALGFFTVYPMRFSFVADHFQYLASIGLLTLIAAAGYRLADALRPAGARLAPAAAVFVLVTLAALTWHQCHAYTSPEILWRATLKHNPAAWIAHINLAPILMGQGNLDEAEAHCREAMQLRPTCTEAYFNRASICLAQGRPDEAVSDLRKAVELAPEVGGFHLSLGMALQTQGKLNEAIDEYHKVLRNAPNDAKAFYQLGSALQAQGEAEQALPQYRQALQAEPDWVEPMIRTAWILATHPDAGIRRADEAVRLAERAADLTRQGDVQVLDTLAAAYAAAGRFDQAAATTQAALRLPAASRIPGLADRLTRQVEMYKQRAAGANVPQ